VRPIVIAAGGTGGHFFPAEALAAALIQRGHRVVLMTDARSGALKSQVFAGREIHTLRVSGVAGRGAAKAARAILSLAAGTLQARSILAGIDAAAVVGFGGYPCVAPIMAARLLRRPPAVVLHEQNAVLGRANRFLARRADLLALGVAATARVPDGVVTNVTGNPVRPAIQALSERGFVPPTDEIRLLVTGGSLGARVFSDVVPDAIAALPAELRAKLRVVQQCRVEDLGRVRAAYKSAGVEADMAPFFTDIAEKLRAAHLVIARAGASTCAEIAVVGRPAILVPLPGAIDDHQAANASALSGAVVLRQADFTPNRLTQTLNEMLNNPATLTAAARDIALCGRARAADDLADAVEALVTRAEASRVSP
jgi:UDP-N-acetylglucosamine--N-acetylmuramyl-(pentapeptide) pyrophosphoryl-undecaprenol N-acetylglucosamine transferase